tara:strand:+ start:102 stop:245 length:144 start_codon:yes stop_codon:yes gene_type:complete
MTEIIDLYWPFIAWCIIVSMCIASAEKWIRRRRIAKYSEIDDRCDDR